MKSLKKPFPQEGKVLSQASAQGVRPHSEKIRGSLYQNLPPRQESEQLSAIGLHCLKCSLNGCLTILKFSFLHCSSSWSPVLALCVCLKLTSLLLVSLGNLPAGVNTFTFSEFKCIKTARSIPRLNCPRSPGNLNACFLLPEVLSSAARISA